MHTALAPQKSEQAKREIVSTVGGSVVSAISPTDLMVSKGRQKQPMHDQIPRAGIHHCRIINTGERKEYCKHLEYYVN